MMPPDLISIPPNDPTAEAALLGCVMLDHRALFEIGPTLDASSFYAENHRIIWRAMERMSASEVAIDPITLADHLSDRGELERVGGPVFLSNLSSSVPSAANAAQYARQIQELYHRRRIQAASKRVSASIASRKMNADDAVAELTEEIDALTRQASGAENPSIQRHTGEWYDRLTRRFSGEESTGFETGIVPMDRLLGGGLEMQRMVGIAALQKMGKSKLAFSAVASLVFDHGFAADIWYTDGPGWAISREMICRLSGVSTTALEDPRRLSEKNHADVFKYTGAVAGADVNIYDRGTPHIRDIALTTKARLSKLGDKPLVLVVDYLQNCTAGHSGPSAERLNITDCSRTLAALRTDYPNLIVLCLLQFNRQGAHRELPMPADLYGASQLEKDLDHLFIFHRPAELREDASVEDKRKGILWHALTKHGPTAQSAMYCDLSINKFELMGRL